MTWGKCYVSVQVTYLLDNTGNLDTINNSATNESKEGAV